MIINEYNRINCLLNNSIRLLSEEYINDVFYVYHATPLKNLDSILKFGFERYYAGRTTGELYGRGVYSTYDFESSLENINGGKYGGKLIIKFEVFTLDRFLIYDNEIAKKKYGSNWTIKDQFNILFPKELIDSFNKISIKDKNVGESINDYNIYDSKLKGNPENAYNYLTNETDGSSSTKCLWLYKASGYYRNNNLNEPYNYIDGFIFNGSNDGYVCFIKDFKNVMPVEYSVDGGLTWIKNTNNSVEKYTKHDFDSEYHYGKRYKKVYLPAYGYAKVIDSNNKINYINKDGIELSSVWFESGSDFEEFPNGRILATVMINDQPYLIDKDGRGYLDVDDYDDYDITDFFE